MTGQNNSKKLYKSKKKVICGVCSGLAEYFNIDPTLVRLVTALISLASIGTGLLAYIIAAIIIPEEPNSTN